MGLLDTPISGWRLSSMNLTAVAVWLIANGPHPVLISIPMLENGLLMTSIRYRLPITRDIFLTLGECSLSIFLSFSEMFRFSWQCPHSFHMRLLRSLPGPHLRLQMSLASSGPLRYFAPFFLMPTSSDFPLESPTIMSSVTEDFSTPLSLACY